MRRRCIQCLAATGKIKSKLREVDLSVSSEDTRLGIPKYVCKDDELSLPACVCGRANDFDKDSMPA